MGMQTRNEHGIGVLTVVIVGMMMTIIAACAPFIDRATTTVLADHIRDGYPGYSSGEVDSAVTAYLMILATVGIFGLAGWIATAWAARADKDWAPWLAIGLLAVAIGIATTGLTVRDTSGDVGLAPVLGWIQVLPCLPGVAAVMMLWRRMKYE